MDVTLLSLSIKVFEFSLSLSRQNVTTSITSRRQIHGTLSKGIISYKPQYIIIIYKPQSIITYKPEYIIIIYKPYYIIR